MKSITPLTILFSDEMYQWITESAAILGKSKHRFMLDIFHDVKLQASQSKPTFLLTIYKLRALTRIQEEVAKGPLETETIEDTSLASLATAAPLTKKRCAPKKVERKKSSARSR
jgi:hypothetical protein